MNFARKILINLKRKFAYLFFLPIVLSCSEEYDFDNSNTYNVASAIHQSLVDQDTLLLKKLYQYNGDSLSEYQRESISEALKFFEKNHPTQLKIDTSSHKPFVGIEHTVHHINLWYAQDSSFYSVRARYERDHENNVVNVFTTELVDLQEQCEFDQKTPFTPSSDIEFMGIVWNTGKHNTSFASGSVRLQNNSEIDIEYIKFRISLSRKLNSSQDENIFLRQTIESRESIFQGDIALIDVPRMSDYQVGFPIKSNEISFDAELIEVRPTPESHWCEKINELKLEQKKLN